MKPYIAIPFEHRPQKAEYQGSSIRSCSIPALPQMSLPSCTSLTETHRLGTLHRHPLAGDPSTAREHLERQGTGMQAVRSATLCPPSPLPGVLMPQPAGNSSGRGFMQRAMLNADFVARCTRRDILPALDHPSRRAPSQSKGRWTAPYTKTRSPGCGRPRRPALRYKAQLDSSVGTAEKAF